MALSPYRLQTDCLYILHMCDIIDQKKVTLRCKTGCWPLDIDTRTRQDRSNGQDACVSKMGMATELQFE